MSSTLIKWPTRARPQLFLRHLPLWLADDTVRVLVSIDADDAACNCDEFLDALDAFDRVKVRVGGSQTKVQAINDGVADEPFEFLILASDDVLPQRPDYGRYLRELHRQHFPEGDGVIHQNDGRAGQRLNTIPVMDRAYFQRFGWVYCPEFKSLWCDNEMTDVSRGLGRAVYVDECILRHAWTEATGVDDLHRRNESFYDADAQTYERRKAAGFPA